MMKLKFTKLLITTLFIVLGQSIFSQITVNSLAELKPYLSQDNVNVKLSPGTYTITEQDVLDRNIGAYETITTRTYYTLLLFSGSGSTYDFTDVTINVETAVFASVGNYTLWEIRIAGNDVTLKNLTLIDVGSKDDAPRKTANNIVMDGKNNVVDGFDVRSTGSYPYGYGDIFGKGGGPIVPHRKHSAILIRGESNTLRNTNLVHKAYGHCVFFQAASSPTVEGCYIEGEVRTSDDMLAEEGTGTIGDEKGFITVWDYKLPPGFMVALCEAGIRAYNAGTTIVDGDTLERGTSNVTVKNTTVKNTRTACTLAHSSGTQYVENITSIGNENGFSIGRGEVVNCKSDAAYGVVYSGGSGITGDITIIEPENGYYNGTNALADVTGGTVTFKSEGVDIPSDLNIKMGTFRSFRHQEGTSLLYQLDTVFSGATVYNYTGAGLELGGGASNNDVFTCGEVFDNGEDNSIEELENCEDGGLCSHTTALIEAECFDEMSGIQTQESSEGTDNVGWIQNGDWTAYNGINLTGMYSVKARVASKTTGGTMEVRLGSETGTLIGSLDVENTSGDQNYETVSVNIEKTEGEQDVYFVYTGGDGYLFNVNWFGFSEEFLCNNTVAHLEAECFDDMSGVETESCDEGTLNVGYVDNGDWIKFESIDLTSMSAFKARVATKNEGGEIEVRIDDEEGQLLGALTVENSGGWQTWVSDSVSITDADGIHDVYLVFKGGNSSLFNVNYVGFYESVITGVNSSEKSDLSAFPNPTDGFVQLSNSAEYEVMNSYGQLVSSGEGNVIDLSKEEKGVYLLRVEGNVLKIVKK